MKKIFITSLLGMAGFLPMVTYAQTPTINSLSSNSSIINSGQPVNFSWTLSNSGGSAYVIPCQDGIKISYSDGTGTLSCGTHYSSSNMPSDAASFLINNISGGTKIVTFQVIPKDSSGVENSAGMMQTQITVYPLNEPITSMSIAPISVYSGDTATLSWAGQVIDGVNLEMDCVDGIQVSSSQYTTSLYMPCGIPIFSSNLSTSGSLPLVFTNNTSGTKTVTLKLLPIITSGTYDGTHAKIVSVDVKPKATVSTSIDYFSASSTSVLSGSSVQVSWSATNTPGVNFFLSCDPSGVSATSSANPNVALSCYQQYIASGDFGGNGTLSFSFKTPDTLVRTATLTIIPSISPGLYDGTKSKSIYFSISKTSPTNNYYSYQTQSTPNSSAGQSASGIKKARLTFSRGLFVGSRGDDVKALQEFFSQDKTVYPEGLTTGYFGPATLRAIQRFQAKYGIVSSGSPETTGYGALGPKTRSYINSLK